MKRIVLATSLGLSVALAFLVLPSALPTARAAGDVFYASHDCTGLSACYPTIQEAVLAAGAGDTVRVVAGTYMETILITESLVLEGGWSPDGTERDWALHVTTIDAQRTGPVIWVNAPVSPTIEGFVITGGDDSAHLGWGGGIKVYLSAPDEGGLTIIRHNVITDNVACQTSGCQGQGGGVHVYRSTIYLESNTIISNVARTNSQGGNGGGVYVGWQSNAVISGNLIAHNTAVYSTTGTWEGEGGGVYCNHSGVELRNNEILNNVAVVSGTGKGGGVYAQGDLYANTIVSNVASVHGPGEGGGVYADYVQDFEDNVVRDNVASLNGVGAGGGLYAKQLQRFKDNSIINNRATRGGGVYLKDFSRTEMRDNYVAHNEATGTSSGPVLDGGGGLYSLDRDLDAYGNVFYSNTTASGGGGILIAAGEGLILRDNSVEVNRAAWGGGIAALTGTGSIVANRIVDNESMLGGGAYAADASGFLWDRNWILQNTATGFFGFSGGGMIIGLDAGTVTTLTNNVLARNAAGSNGLGGGIFLNEGEIRLFNNTLVDNDRGTYREGLFVAGGDLQARNNVFVGHSAGVSVTGGTVALDYNAYFDNDVDVVGASWGAHHLTADPRFVDRAGGDYHLLATSTLVDAGDPAVPVAHDVDGDARPRGAGVDVGADEVYRSASYVSAITGDDVAGTGEPTAPFASVTRGISETGSGGIVYVGRGRYTESITISHSLRLVGGYHEGDWNPSVTTYPTTLDADGMGRVVTIFGAGVHAVVDGFTITGGLADFPMPYGGGVLVQDGATVELWENVVTENRARTSGGGIALWIDDGTGGALVTMNRIHNNVSEGLPPHPMGLAPQQNPMPGGGALIFGPVQMVNNFVYGNTASGQGGDGIAVGGADRSPRLSHNTVVDNGGSAGVGIELIEGGEESTLYNNLVVGHGTGISATVERAATWDYNGFYDNGADYAPGLTAGAHDVVGDPHFVDRAGGDYHIGPGVMAGAGRDTGLLLDIDGETRPNPMGAAPDIGADEIAERYLYLPVVLRGS